MGQYNYGAWPSPNFSPPILSHPGPGMAKISNSTFYTNLSRWLKEMSLEGLNFILIYFVIGYFKI